MDLGSALSAIVSEFGLGKTTMTVSIKAGEKIVSLQCAEAHGCI